MALMSGVKALKQSVGVIERSIREGISGRSVMKSLRDAGFSFRTSRFYQVHREVKRWVDQWEKIKYVNRDKRLGERFFEDSLGFQSQTYKWKVSVTMFSPRRGEWIEFFTDIVSDENRTIGEVYESALHGAFTQISHYQVKWGSMRIYQATRKTNRDFWSEIE